jgi:hypothetical protein
VRFRPLAPPAPVFQVAVVASPDAGTATASFLQLAAQAEPPRRRLLAAA